jgi:MoaA/NifB/PqqE/SkfB family radical SAM enzyme
MRKNLKLKMVINQTIIDEEGINEFTRLRKYLGLYDIQINAVLAYETSAIYNRQQEMNLAPSASGQYGTFGKFSPRQIDQLVRALDQDLKRSDYLNSLVKRYYLRGIQERVAAGMSFPNPKCVALNSHLRIMPDGQIPICQFNTAPVGDFRSQTFEEIWFGDEIKVHRDWVKNCPGCWAECEVLPNAVYSGDLFKHPFIKYRGMDS